MSTTGKSSWVLRLLSLWSDATSSGVDWASCRISLALLTRLSIPLNWHNLAAPRSALQAGQVFFMMSGPVVYQVSVQDWQPINWPQHVAIMTGRETHRRQILHWNASLNDVFMPKGILSFFVTLKMLSSFSSTSCRVFKIGSISCNSGPLFLFFGSGDGGSGGVVSFLSMA